MRIDLAPIIEQAQALLSAIEAKSRGPARDAAHRLMCALPLPSWADPAPGVSIFYGPEQWITVHAEQLRYSTAQWTMWLNEHGEPGDKWPYPRLLEEATQELMEYLPQNASVSANTPPAASQFDAGSEP